MVPDPLAVIVCFTAVFLIAFTKGAFGGGFAIIGIPLFALVMDPITAGAILAPLFCLMDIVALRYWRPSTGRNLVKVGPWLAIAEPTGEFWILMALTLPAIPLGIWSGWRLHGRLDQRQLYGACYALLVVVALKLLWDGLAGYLQP